jgi:hypothetical protein
VASNCAVGFLGSDPNSGQGLRAGQERFTDLGSDPNNPGSNHQFPRSRAASAVASKCVVVAERNVFVFILAPFCLALASVGLAGSRPAGEFPFFACPKKGNRKKRQPESVPLRGPLRCCGFWGQSPNSPSLRLAQRVRRFAPQRNWCLTPITETRFAQTTPALIRPLLRCSALPQRRRIQDTNIQNRITNSKIYFGFQCASARVLPLFIAAAKCGISSLSRPAGRERVGVRVGPK